MGQVRVGEVRKKKKKRLHPPTFPEQGSCVSWPCYRLPPRPPWLRQGELPTAFLNRCDSKFKAEVTDLDPKAFEGKGRLLCLTV